MQRGQPRAPLSAFPQARQPRLPLPSKSQGGERKSFLRQSPSVPHTHGPRVCGSTFNLAGSREASPAWRHKGGEGTPALPSANPAPTRVCGSTDSGSSWAARGQSRPQPLRHHRATRQGGTIVPAHRGHWPVPPRDLAGHSHDACDHQSESCLHIAPRLLMRGLTWGDGGTAYGRREAQAPARGHHLKPWDQLKSSLMRQHHVISCPERCACV